MLLEWVWLFQGHTVLYIDYSIVWYGTLHFLLEIVKHDKNLNKMSNYVLLCLYLLESFKIFANVCNYKHDSALLQWAMYNYRVILCDHFDVGLKKLTSHWLV